MAIFVESYIVAEAVERHEREFVTLGIDEVVVAEVAVQLLDKGIGVLEEKEKKFFDLHYQVLDQ